MSFIRTAKGRTSVTFDSTTATALAVWIAGDVSTPIGDAINPTGWTYGSPIGTSGRWAYHLSPNTSAAHTLTLGGLGYVYLFPVVMTNIAGYDKVTVSNPSAANAGPYAFQAGALTPAEAGEHFIAAITLGAAADVDTGSPPTGGFALAQNQAGLPGQYYGGAIATKVQTGGAAAENPTWTTTAPGVNTEHTVSIIAFRSSGGGGGGAATAITLSGPSSGSVGVPSTNFTVGANGTITGTVTVTPSDGGGGGTFTPSGVTISSASPTATFTYTPASAGAKTISVTNNGGLSNPSNLTYTASVPAATQLVLTVPDAAGLSGFTGVVLSAASPGAGVSVIKTLTGLTFNGSGQATIDISGLSVPVGAYRWVNVTNSNGTPSQSPAPVQASGPVIAS